MRSRPAEIGHNVLLRCALAIVLTTPSLNKRSNTKIWRTCAQTGLRFVTRPQSRKTYAGIFKRTSDRLRVLGNLVHGLRLADTPFERIGRTIQRRTCTIHINHG